MSQDGYHSRKELFEQNPKIIYISIFFDLMCAFLALQFLSNKADRNS